MGQDLKISRRALLAGAAYVGLDVSTNGIAVAQGAPKDFKGEELVVQVYGGSVGKWWDGALAKPFAKQHNVKLTVVEGQTGDVVAKMRANAGRPQFDVWMAAENGANIIAAEGLSEPLRVATMPNLASVIPTGRKSGDAFVFFSLASTTFAYNTKQLKADDLPKKWADLADPKYKGKLLLPGGANVFSTMMIARLAHLYGGSVDNVDPAFAALKKIAPNVQTYWTSYDQCFALLTSGEASIAVTAADRTVDMALKGAPVAAHYTDDGGIFIGNAVGISKGTEHRELAEAYLNYVLSPKSNEATANAFGFIPVNKDTTMDPKVAALLPQGAAYTNTLQADWVKISQNQSAWAQRYAKEIVSQ
jgi:putative spermidine/putrescine transport system substrate-binding protein